ncbi:MAG: hypothetical protein ACI9BF_000770 [Candidatus Paceibacteria bacterium]|jgi:hypothetical protein
MLISLSLNLEIGRLTFVSNSIEWPVRIYEFWKKNTFVAITSHNAFLLAARLRFFLSKIQGGTRFLTNIMNESRERIFFQVSE